MLSREETELMNNPEHIVCINSESKYVKFRNKNRDTFYMCKNDDIFCLDHEKEIETKVVEQPKGYYCEECLFLQYRKEHGIIAFEDGECAKFWDQCPECKLKAARSMAARKWSEVIRMIPNWKKEIKFATMTIKNPEWKLKDVGFNWDLWDEEGINNFLQNNCRSFYDQKNEITRWKYLGEMPYLIQQTNKAMRNKLKLRLKNMRHKLPRFKELVKGGIVCYEYTMNVCPIEKTISLNPHIHCILNTKWYDQCKLQEDWGLGRVDIRPIYDTWKVQLEIAKYVGKDGSRRTAWGSLRKLRKLQIQHINKECVPLECIFCHKK